MTDVEEAYTRAKIIAALEKANDQVKRGFKSLSLDEFYTRQGNAWSACDTLRHLIKSVSPIVLALRLPKFALSLCFGKLKEPKSRQYFQIKEVYLEALRQGAQAGRFAPDYFEIPNTQHDAEKLRRKTIIKWHKTGRRLLSALDNWSNYQLDKYTLPHPVLGKLTIREMLFFTIYHELHHLNTVKNRLQKDVSGNGES